MTKKATASLIVGPCVILMALGLVGCAHIAAKNGPYEKLRLATYELVQDPSSEKKRAVWQSSLEALFPIGTSHDEVLEILGCAPSSSFHLEEDNSAERRVIFLLKPDPHLWNRLDVWIKFGADIRVVGYNKFFLIGPANE
jgi:hypothetical protein